jgi:V8-like Glu-specific endopeptidase
VRALALLAALLLAAPAAGEGGRRMLTEAEAPAWAAVGRLNVAGRRFCTATLITDRHALTAAHCLYNPRTRAPVAAAEFRFLAGLGPDGHARVRMVTRLAAPPDYRYDPRPAYAQVALDLAVVELDPPFGPDEARPFALDRTPGWDAPGPVVSYARDRAFAPSIEATCPVRAADEGVAALVCDVEQGASGSPVFRTAGGAPVILGVVSAYEKETGTAWAVRATRAADLLAAIGAGP